MLELAESLLSLADKRRCVDNQHSQNTIERRRLKALVMATCDIRQLKGFVGL